MGRIFGLVFVFFFRGFAWRHNKKYSSTHKIGTRIITIYEHCWIKNMEQRIKKTSNKVICYDIQLVGRKTNEINTVDKALLNYIRMEFIRCTFIYFVCPFWSAVLYHHAPRIECREVESGPVQSTEESQTIWYCHFFLCCFLYWCHLHQWLCIAIIWGFVFMSFLLV